MLDLLKTIDFVKKDFYEKKSIDPCYDFFYSSMLIHIMSLEIASASYSNNCLSFEMLCKKIPPKLGCRSTIYSSLDLGVQMGFFIKKFSKKDRRIRFYCLSETYSLMITNWYLDQKKYFSN